MNSIFIIATDFYPSNTGLSNATTNLVNCLKKDYDVTVFSNGNKENQNQLEGIDTIYIKLNSLLNLFANYKQICLQANKKNPKIIMFETNTFTLLQNLILRKYRDIVAVRIHSTVDAEVLAYRKGRLARIYHKLDFDFMKKVKYIISTNNYHIDFIRTVLLQGNIYDIWGDKQYFVLPNISNSVSKSLPKLETENYYLSLAKMNEGGYYQKGIQDILLAIRQLAKNSELKNDFKIKIIGEGKFRNKYIEIAMKLGISNYVEFIGSQKHDEVEEHLKKCKAVILPSHYEGQSMFITEALSQSCPLIITTDNGMKDMLIDNENGFSIKNGDIDDLVSKIKKFEQLSQQQIADMKGKSRKLYEKLYSDSIIHDKFDEIITIIDAFKGE